MFVQQVVNFYAESASLVHLDAFHCMSYPLQLAKFFSGPAYANSGG